MIDTLIVVQETTTQPEIWKEYIATFTPAIIFFPTLAFYTFGVIALSRWVTRKFGCACDPEATRVTPMRLLYAAADMSVKDD